MSFFKDWLTGIVGASMLLSIVMAVLPNSSAKKAVKLCGGLVLIIMALSPLQKWQNIDLSAGLTGLAAAQENIVSNEAMKELIRERSSAYIVNKAQALGLDIAADVICETEGIYPQPYMVTVTAKSAEAAQTALSGMIEKELGVPLSRQRYIFGG